MEKCGPSAFQLWVTMLKSDKIWCAYLVVNCVGLRTFWTPLVKTLRLEKSWNSRRPVKEFPQKEWSRLQNQPGPTHTKMMLMVRLTVILVAVIPNSQERLTTSPFVQTWSAVRTTKLCILIYVAPPAPRSVVVHFNYVTFAAEYCYKLLLMCAKNCQIWLRRFKHESKKVCWRRFFGSRCMWLEVLGLPPPYLHKLNM